MSHVKVRFELYCELVGNDVGNALVAQ